MFLGIILLAGKFYFTIYYFIKREQLRAFIPGYWQFLMHTGTKVVPAKLDNEFLRSKEKSCVHTNKLIEQED